MKLFRLRGPALIPTLLLLLIPGCSGSTGPTAGTLIVSLSTPHADDGGVLLTVAGGQVDSVEAIGHQVFSSHPHPDTLELIIAGNLGAGPIARLRVPDTRQSSAYTVSLKQVAARGSYLQRDPTLYKVSLSP